MTTGWSYNTIEVKKKKKNVITMIIWEKTENNKLIVY